MKMKMKIEESFNKRIKRYTSEKQKIVDRNYKKIGLANVILMHWEEINPSKISDEKLRTINYNRKDDLGFLDKILSPKYHIYHQKWEYPESKEVRKKRDSAFKLMGSYSKKFYNRKMSLSEYQYFDIFSREKIIEDIKKGRIESEINKLKEKLE